MTFAPSTSTSPAWQPILRDDLAGQALDAVQAIAEDLLRFVADPHPSCPWWGLKPGYELSLASGWAGLALFFAELDHARPGSGHGDLALNLLDRAISGVGEQEALWGLYGGFPGVAWTMEYLAGRFYEDEDPGEEAAAALTCQLDHSPWTGDYELINGLAGWGVYALERWPRPLAAECLKGVVARLAETAEARPDGIAWRTPPERIAPGMRGDFPEGNFNLGVSHGVPGVIPVLAGACAAGIDGARPLLDGAVSWLLARKLPPGAGSVFPNLVTPAPGEEEAFEPSGLAWCYGDLGIACALLAAARSVEKLSWEREALEIARTAAARLSASEEPVDAGLCHGTAGLGHLFNRLHQETGDPAFATAARHWFERTLARRSPGEGLGGFQCWMTGPGGALGWWDEPGLLMGSAGIGLALLAAAVPGEPAWDRVLLSSLPWIPRCPPSTLNPGRTEVRPMSRR